VADTRNINGIIPQYAKVAEDKIGFDIRLDLVVGFWLEGSWTKKNAELGPFTNQEILNAGFDYTFGVGNGIYLIFEQLIAAGDSEAFRFENTSSFRCCRFHIRSLFDNISGIVYYDWKNRNSYNFLTWQKQFRNISMYVMGYWNPDKYEIPAQGNGQNLFAGKGVQVMLVLNH
jgi:hypothetical protein